MILTSAQLFEQFAPKTERVKIFDTDHELIVRALPVHVMAAAQGHKSSDAFVFVNAVVDESGKRYWTDEQIDEVASKISNDVIQLVVLKAYQLGSMSKERMDEIKKNWKTLTGLPTGESASP